MGLLGGLGNAVARVWRAITGERAVDAGPRASRGTAFRRGRYELVIGASRTVLQAATEDDARELRREATPRNRRPADPPWTLTYLGN